MRNRTLRIHIRSLKIIPQCIIVTLVLFGTLSLLHERFESLQIYGGRFICVLRIIFKCHERFFRDRERLICRGFRLFLFCLRLGLDLGFRICIHCPVMVSEFAVFFQCMLGSISGLGHNSAIAFHLKGCAFQIFSG